MPHQDAQLRIVFINDIAFIIETLAPELRMLGVDSRVVGRPSRGPDTQTHGFIRNLSSIVRNLRGLGDFNLLHVNYALYGPVALLERGKPSVIHCHGSDVRPLSGIMSRAVNAFSLRSMAIADQVWYSTTDLGPILRNRSVDGVYMPNPVPRHFLQQASPLPEVPHVLFAVPMSHVKGADVAIAAMKQITHKDPTLKVSTFAFGSSLGEAQRLKSMLPRNVRLVPWTEPESLPALLSSASIIVGRLNLASFGITELESMAIGRPLIANVPGSLRRLEPYYTEDPPFVHCATPDDVTTQVLSLTRDYDKCARLGAQGKAWAARYHSADGVARMYLSHYHEILESRSRA